MKVFLPLMILILGVTGCGDRPSSPERSEPPPILTDAQAPATDEQPMTVADEFEQDP